MPRVRFCLALLAVAAGARGAAALTPQEVLIVANARSADSVALAKFYAQQRRIPEQNIVTVKTSTLFWVGRADYEREIRDPIRQALVERKLARKIRSLVLMYHVPGFIARTATTEGSPLLTSYRAAKSRAHYRLKIDYKLLGTVCRKFPPPRTEGLQPIGKLFSPAMPEPRRSPASVPDLLNDIRILLKTRQRQVAALADPSHRRIASRQLMALHRDLYGLKGLIRYLADHKPQGAPDPDELKKQIAEAQRQWTKTVDRPRRKDQLQAKLKLIGDIDGLTTLYSTLQQRLAKIQPRETVAAVDNELALLWWGTYRLGNFLPNPLHWRFRTKTRRPPPPVLMTARIDGPSKADAMRMIRASVAAEQAGLQGTFYIDAGGGARVKSGGYDRHLKALHAFVRANTKLKVVLDESPAVFARATPYSKVVSPKLLTGKWTIAECYWRTMPMVSWRMTLIADPLYNPFAANPQVAVDVLKPGLAPGP